MSDSLKNVDSPPFPDSVVRRLSQLASRHPRYTCSCHNRLELLYTRQPANQTTTIISTITANKLAVKAQFHRFGENFTCEHMTRQILLWWNERWSLSNWLWRENEAWYELIATCWKEYMNKVNDFRMSLRIEVFLFYLWSWWVFFQKLGT